MTNSAFIINYWSNLRDESFLNNILFITRYLSPDVVWSSFSASGLLWREMSVKGFILYPAIPWCLLWVFFFRGWLLCVVCPSFAWGFLIAKPKAEQAWFCSRDSKCSPSSLAWMTPVLLLTVSISCLNNLSCIRQVCDGSLREQTT